MQELENKDFYKQKLAELEGAWSETYESVRSDLEFLSGGSAMWGKSVYKTRTDDNRPAVSVPLLNPYVDAIVAPCRLTPPNIGVKAVNEEVETLVNGIIRGIEMASGSSECYSTSLEQAVGAGLGWLYSEVIDEEQGPELRIRCTQDPLAIMIDPLSTRVDGSDAQYAVYRGYISKDEANRTFDVEIEDGEIEKGSTTATFFNIPEGSYSDCIWYRLTKEGMSITRTVGSTEVYSQSFPGVNKLPVVPVVGEQLYAGASNVRLGGLVRRGRELNESFNITLSNIMELVALAPKAPWVGPHEAFKDNLNVWGTANTQPHSYLGYKHIDKAGNPIAAPQRADNSVQTQGLQSVADWLLTIQSRAIGMNDVQLGGLATAQESGKSLIARMEAADAGSKGQYMDHLTLSISQLAKSIVQMLPLVYAGERTISVIDDNGNASSISGDIRTILTPEVVDYLDVEIQSGPQKEGQRKVAGQVIETAMASSGPDKGMLLMDLWLDTQDLPNKDSLKARIQKMIPAELLEDVNPEEDPMAVAALEEASAVIDEKDQTIQWMEAELAKLQQQVLSSDNLVAVELRKAEISAQTTLTKAQMDNSAKYGVESLKQGSEDVRTATKLDAAQEKQLKDIMADMHAQNRKIQADADKAATEMDIQTAIDVPQFIAEDIIDANNNTQGEI
tara:strand:- start:141 stop:2162 length:2022 start_codon:yes stop_codon:yes gene_type:complete